MCLVKAIKAPAVLNPLAATFIPGSEIDSPEIDDAMQAPVVLNALATTFIPDPEVGSPKTKNTKRDVDANVYTQETNHDSETHSDPNYPAAYAFNISGDLNICEIRESSIKNAGLGLFAKKTIRPNQIVAHQVKRRHNPDK